MAMEVVDLPIKNGGSFHSYFSNVYQRVNAKKTHMIVDFPIKTSIFMGISH